MIARAHPIDLLFVIAPHSLVLDIAGPAEAFRLANLHRHERGQPPRFRLRFAGPEPILPTSVGLGLANLEPLPEQLSGPTWVVLVGQPKARLDQATAAIGPSMTKTRLSITRAPGARARSCGNSSWCVVQ